MSRQPPGTRKDYGFFHQIETRWMDNDIYGHVNNVIYYSYFDTVIAQYLMSRGGLDPWGSEVIGYAVESGCRYHSAINFPDRIHAGLRVTKVGNSSARYEIGIFKNDVDQACAEGFFVHVFVNRGNERPVQIPGPIRSALTEILIDPDSRPS